MTEKGRQVSFPMSGPGVQTSSEGDRDSGLTRGSGWGRNWNAGGGGGEGVSVKTFFNLFLNSVLLILKNF